MLMEVTMSVKKLGLFLLSVLSLNSLYSKSFYKSSLPEDICKDSYKLWNFSDPKNTKLNEFRKESSDKMRSVLDIQMPNRRTSDTAPYASAKFQEQFRYAKELKNIDAPIMLKQGKHNNFQAFYNKVSDLIYVNEDYYSDYEIFLHELNHYRYDASCLYFNADTFLMYQQKFPTELSMFQSKEDVCIYEERQAEISRLEYISLDSMKNFSKDIVYDNAKYTEKDHFNEKGYLTAIGVAYYAQRAEEQLKQASRNNKLHSAFENIKKQIASDMFNQMLHWDDPELTKLSLDDLRKEYEEFKVYKKNLLEHSLDQDTTFEAINNHKQDVLLGIHRELQFEKAFADYFPKGENRKKVIDSLSKSMFHLNRDLKEQAYINARFYGQNLSQEQKYSYFYELRADQMLSQDIIVNTPLSSTDKLQDNSDWVTREIQRATLEHDQEEVARLTLIKEDYLKQAQEAGVAVE